MFSSELLLYLISATIYFNVKQAVERVCYVSVTPRNVKEKGGRYSF